MTDERISSLAKFYPPNAPIKAVTAFKGSCARGLKRGPGAFHSVGLLLRRGIVWLPDTGADIRAGRSLGTSDSGKWVCVPCLAKDPKSKAEYSAQLADGLLKFGRHMGHWKTKHGMKACRLLRPWSALLLCVVCPERAPWVVHLLPDLLLNMQDFLDDDCWELPDPERVVPFWEEIEQACHGFIDPNLNDTLKPILSKLLPKRSEPADDTRIANDMRPSEDTRPAGPGTEPTSPWGSQSAGFDHGTPDPADPSLSQRPSLEHVDVVHSTPCCTLGTCGHPQHTHGCAPKVPKVALQQPPPTQNSPTADFSIPEEAIEDFKRVLWPDFPVPPGQVCATDLVACFTFE